MKQFFYSLCLYVALSSNYAEAACNFVKSYSLTYDGNGWFVVGFRAQQSNSTGGGSQCEAPVVMIRLDSWDFYNADGSKYDSSSHVPPIQVYFTKAPGSTAEAPSKVISSGNTSATYYETTRNGEVGLYDGEAYLYVSDIPPGTRMQGEIEFAIKEEDENDSKFKTLNETFVFGSIEDASFTVWVDALACVSFCSANMELGNLSVTGGAKVDVPIYIETGSQLEVSLRSINGGLNHTQDTTASTIEYQVSFDGRNYRSDVLKTGSSNLLSSEVITRDIQYPLSIHADEPTTGSYPSGTYRDELIVTFSINQ